MTWAGDRSCGQVELAGGSDQLERLLAGLDELSGTLPDLGQPSANPPFRSAVHQPPSRPVNQRPPVQPWAEASGHLLSSSRETSILSDISDMPATTAGRTDRRGSDGRRAGNGSRRGSENGRTYEDDVDYVLEKGIFDLDNIQLISL